MPCVIDPGHGGEVDAGRSTPLGLVTRSGVREKDLTLALARDVVARLGGAAVLTRDRDVNLSLAERCAVSRRHRAPAFVSIHASEGARNSVYVHHQAGRASYELAHALAGEIRAGVSAEPLAVLHPGQHPPGTAAVMIEVDPAAAARLGGAIAAGVARYGQRCAQLPVPLPRPFGVKMFMMMDTPPFLVLPAATGSFAGVNIDLTAQLTGNVNPQEPPEDMPPMFLVLLKACGQPPPGPTPPPVTVGPHNIVSSNVTFADGQPWSMSTLVPGPGSYFWHFVKPFRHQEIEITGNTTP